MEKLSSGKVHESYAAMTIKDALRDDLYPDGKEKYRAAKSMIPKLLDTIFGVGAWEETSGNHNGKQTKFYKKRNN